MQSLDISNLTNQQQNLDSLKSADGLSVGKNVDPKTKIENVSLEQLQKILSKDSTKKDSSIEFIKSLIESIDEVQPLKINISDNSLNKENSNVEMLNTDENILQELMSEKDISSETIDPSIKEGRRQFFVNSKQAATDKLDIDFESPAIKVISKNRPQVGTLNHNQGLDKIMGEVKNDEIKFDFGQKQVSHGLFPEVFEKQGQIKKQSQGKNLLNSVKLEDVNTLFPQEFRKNLKGNISNYVKGNKLQADNLIKFTPNELLGNTEAKEGVSLFNKSSLSGSSSQENVVEFNKFVQNLDNRMPQTIAESGTKILDLSNINTDNRQEIISKITEYLEQSQIKNRPNLDLIVKHDSLGNFKINASKNMETNQIELKIVTMNNKGFEFFTRHENHLAQSVMKAGINLSNLKIFAHSDAKGFESESRQFSQNQESSGRGQDSNQGNQKQSQNHDSQKRQRLWEDYRERFSA